MTDLTAFIVSPRAQDWTRVEGAPNVTASSAELLREVEVLDETGARRRFQVPVERPMTIVLDGAELVTLMTLGARPELLVLGYLRNQRVIDDVAEVESIDVDCARGLARVVRRVKSALGGRVRAGEGPGGEGPGGEGLRGEGLRGEARLVGTACSLGTEFGELMRGVDAAAVAPLGTVRISRSQLLRILEVTREYDAVHRAAGSVHGCALFQGADLLVSLEDVSRHNGLDTVTGWMMLYGVAGHDKTLFTTGRLTGEMVMKAAYNGISIMVSRNGVTSMGLDLARKLGMALFGRAAKGRYLCYTGAERFVDA